MPLKFAYKVLKVARKKKDNIEVPGFLLCYLSVFHCSNSDLRSQMEDVYNVTNIKLPGAKLYKQCLGLYNWNLPSECKDG